MIELTKTARKTGALGGEGILILPHKQKQIPWYHRLSAKLMPTFADRWYSVVSATDPYGRILAFLG
jgi:hypothetical protein